ncbi:GerAB/ArcD/ProY family transporter [Desulfofundulus sp. TPOSR]|uniref:GerAB/ArcD/ProY family transporter n=1 Tax=Desulfofundulus sp. TPOSR TaxID=2714340 RepID=UPI001409E037|nr:GerAB/ArcD/ProY family transporter [Desulfofundulus sp. TPOSR]NHM28387.1 GerAB/ArcD/ProY family transporter [Desulfofundulus sp. TPOSR]QSS05778.1 GerAB/ArcD/ProY family transporter [Klebsiella pneumoniae]
MHDPGKISGLQMVYLLINVVGATALVFLPGFTASIVERDAWVTPVLATLPGFYVILVITALGRRFPDRTIVQYIEKLLGPWLGKIIAFFYVLFFLHVNGVIVREFGELVAAAIMPQTPQVVFSALMVAVCSYGVYHGLEVVARVMELIYPLMLILFGLILILVSGHMQPANLFPMLQHDFKTIIRASLNPIAWRGEVFLLGMFFPYLARPDLARRNGIIAVAAIGLILTINALACTAVFDVSTGRFNFATFELVRLAGFGTFLTRLDAIWIIIWIVGIFGKIALFHYAAIMGTVQLLRLKDHRTVIVPLSILLIALSLSQFKNLTEMVAWINGPWIPYAFLFEMGIPTFLLLLAFLREKPAFKRNPSK